jgi:hypothetical protein
MKRCTKCGELKPRTEFYAEKACRDGLRGECKACFAARAKVWYGKNREKAIANAAAWRKANLERARATRRARSPLIRERTRDQHLRRTFGISSEEYDSMLARQGGVCAVCRQPPKADESFHVDHHDERGGIRGVLCVRCNNALGQLREDVDVAERAVDYLAANGFVRTGEYDLLELAVARARCLVKAPG